MKLLLMMTFRSSMRLKGKRKVDNSPPTKSNYKKRLQKICYFDNGKKFIIIEEI